jgi:tripartite-type tricarboxylate transporter receptor subunit TctC
VSLPESRLIFAVRLLGFLIGGQTQVMFATMPTILPYVKNDKLRGLAVTGATRDPSMPDLPSISKTLPGFDVNN